MPANLPPQYFDAEKAFRMARTAPEKIAALEEMLAIMPKHKGTDHLRGELRSRIAKLTQTIDKKTATHRASMVLEKEGAAQVAVIGLPNAGKSQLVSSLTNASLTVAEYPFTTQAATPAMMEFENIKVQLVDTPPLAHQTVDYWFPLLLRRADALIVVVDLSEEPLTQMEDIIGHLEKMRISIGIGTAGEEVILSRQKALVVGCKLDLDHARHNYTALQEAYGERLPVVAVSTREGTGLDEFKNEVFRILEIIRVYTKTPGQKPDLTDPIILKSGSTLDDAATEVHKDFRSRLKFARLWGSGKYDGIRIRRDHILRDGDIIELHL